MSENTPRYQNPSLPRSPEFLRWGASLISQGRKKLTLRWITGQQNLTKLQTLGPDYTFPKVFGALNPNLTSQLLQHVRFSRNPNLQVGKTGFFAILGVK